MGSVKLFVCGLLVVGSVLGDNWRSDSSQDSDELAKKDYYPERLQEAYKAYGHCVLFNSMTTTVNNSDIAKQCVEVSTIQSLLPALYVEVTTKASSCIENVYEALMDTPEWEEIESVFTRFLERRAEEREFCAFLDIFLGPLICGVRNRCSGSSEKQITDGVLAAYYSIQQFLNNGMDTEFRCKKTNIRVNPALYEFGTKYDTDMKYLTKELQCKDYEPKTTTTTTSTTAESSTTTGWDFGSESDDDESRFGKWFGSSEMSDSTAEKSEEEPSTTTKKPSKYEPTRVRSARQHRRRSDH